MNSPNLTPSIVLSTLNAKYIHASLGLRYLLANMGELSPMTALREFTIARKAQDIVDELLFTLESMAATTIPGVSDTQIIGFGVYIWNVQQTTAVVRLLKAARPGIKIVLGGPEVSYEANEQEIVRLADHVITGWGDLSFAKLCRDLMRGTKPLKIVIGEQPALDQIALPYAKYSDTDLAHRQLYVEASRGCPFKCEFCLSALDKTAWAFDLDVFLAEMQFLYQRGARNFKFVDRTFNLNIDTSVRILRFFLDHLTSPDSKALPDDLFVHFEVVPDHLPDRLKQIIAQFPPGVLQLEVGVQSFSVEVQQRISRRQDNARSEANMRWLLAESNAHLHTDLIFGLPGETLESFAAGFDRLYAMKPHEIQLGLLKRLRGTPIARHTADYGMVYDSTPPYTVLQTGVVDASTMQRITRFARYWDKLANSGRFAQSLLILLNDRTATPTQNHAEKVASPFYAFLDFSDWLWKNAEKTNDLSPEFLIDAMFAYLTERGVPVPTIQTALLADYETSGARGSPRTLRGLLAKRGAPKRPMRVLAQRQERHAQIRQTVD